MQNFPLYLSRFVWLGLAVVGFFFLFRFGWKLVREWRRPADPSDYKLGTVLAIIGLAIWFIVRFVETFSGPWGFVMYLALPALASLVGGFIKPERVWRWALATISLQIVTGIVLFVRDQEALIIASLFTFTPILVLICWAGAEIGSKLRKLMKKGQV